ncbi:hypothetical protein HHK36_012545 [Tetracentron sinense]|uniref:Uncharacterized protein n=1 Tax=Tetracentron sinense TaxID=13715 RepID=A0A835DIS0_TETSI|nr:hypothetical protein HHK36_012545 [Tetracentron sinense]
MKGRGTSGSIGLYAIQCTECLKFRVIPTQQEYEDIRSRLIEDPWVCNKKPNVSCEDPADIEYDTNRTWVIDKPNIPKTPVGFERGLTLRKDYSKLDAYYATPSGKKVRAPAEVEKFLEANPKYKGVAVSDFNFAVPKIMPDTIPGNVEGKGSASGSKKMRTSKTDDV